LVGEESCVGFGEGHFDRRGALAGRYGDDLLGGRYGFLVIINESDLNFAIRCDEEFRVRFDGGQDASAVRAWFFLFVAMVWPRMERERAKDGDGEWQDACGFHFWVFGEILL
jgi:hypothetical protein